MLIASRQNPRLKALIRLLQRRERDATGTFLVEGQREVSRALAAGLHLQCLYYCPVFHSSEPSSAALVESIRSEGVECVELVPGCFEKVSRRNGPDGFLAVAETPQRSLAELKLSQPPLILLVEGVEKPGNLGALIRSADAVGAVVLASGEGTDFYNPHVIRNSQGAVFSMPCLAANPQDLLEFFRNNSIRLVGTCPEAETTLWQSDLRGPLALAVGSEAEGLSGFWQQHSQAQLRIPMLGQADSLNVSVSAALCLYEARRQRQQVP